MTVELKMGGGSVLPAHLPVAPWQGQVLSFGKLFAASAEVIVPKVYLSWGSILVLCSLFLWLRVISAP